MGPNRIASSAVVTLIFRRDQIDHPLDAFAFIVPAIERRPIVTASFPGVKFADREDTGLTPIRVFLVGALHHDVLDSSDADLIEFASRQSGPLLSIHGVRVDADVTRWPASMPQCHVGHLKRIAAIERHVGRWKGLEIAGYGYWGVGIPQCFRSGQAAVERLIACAARAPSIDGRLSG